jgi:hypothetical protein
LIVVDASVLTDFLLGRPQTVTVMERDMVEREHEPFHAPELVEPETLNALRGLVRGGAITDRRATEAVGDLASVRLLRYPHAPLRETGLGVAGQPERLLRHLPRPGRGPGRLGSPHRRQRPRNGCRAIGSASTGSATSLRATPTDHARDASASVLAEARHG